jgi:hypothetical protein
VRITRTVTTPTHVDAPAAPLPDTERWARRVLLGATALFIGLRLLVVRAADLPTITPDEPGTWAVARWVSGVEGDLLMQHMPRYPLVPGAVLAPTWWLPVDAATRYRLALVLLGALTVCAAVAVRAALRRLGADPMAASLGFAVVLLSASTNFAGAFTWAEPVALAWVALMVLATTVLAVEPVLRPWQLVAAGVVAGSAPFVHGRLTLVPLIWIGLLLARRRRLGIGLTVAAAAATVLTAVVLATLDRRLSATVWTDPEPAVAGGPASWVTDPGFWSTLVTTSLGQLWYLVVSSAGLAVAGVALLVRTAWKRDGGDRRLAAGSLLALLGSNLAISCVVMAGFLHGTEGRAGIMLSSPRWDHMIYGRYNDAVIVVLSALGVLWCWNAAGRARAVRPFAVAAVAATVAAAVVAAAMASAAMASADLDPSFPPNFAGLSALPVARMDPDLLAWTVAALVVIALMGAAARSGRRGIAIVVATWAVAGAVAGTSDAVRMHRYDLAVDVADRLGDPGVLEVAADAADLPALRMAVFATQYELLSAGWTTRFASSDSPALSGSTDADAVLLRAGVVPSDPDFVRIADYGDVTAWERR